jgi:hypothetical protein
MKLGQNKRDIHDFVSLAILHKQLDDIQSTSLGEELLMPRD